MLFSLALMLFLGFLTGWIMQKLRLPPLLGMMVTGVLLGPQVLNLIDPTLLDLSPDLRKIALIVILIRAGLALDLEDLKAVGRPAILMCFVPATFELVSVTLLAPPLLGIGYLEAAIMGAVLAAVSPAVIVPRMLKLMEEGYGEEKHIPQLLLAGASVDDIFVIVLFTCFTGVYQGQQVGLMSLLNLPLSILLGLLLGIVSGLAMLLLFRHVPMRDTVKVLLVLGLCFLFVTLEEAAAPFVSVSGLLAVMALGSTILQRHPVLARRIAVKYSKVWVGSELLLFVLVGAAVDIHALSDVGFGVLLLLCLSLLIRMTGVFLCLVHTNLNRKERLFAMLSYLPKATVQAAIGGIPLTLGMPAGNKILAVAVLAIFLTAPLGAIGIDRSYRRLLSGPDRQAN